MKIGDLVIITQEDIFVPANRHKRGRSNDLCGSTPGIIIDSIEMDDGFFEHEVMLGDGDVGWYSDLILTVISDYNTLMMETIKNESR